MCAVLAADGTVMEEIPLAASQTKGNHSRTVLVPKKLQDELTNYLQQRFGLANLLAVTQTDTQRALFPTQKNPKRGFTANTLCQLIQSSKRVDGGVGGRVAVNNQTFSHSAVCKTVRQPCYRKA